MKDFRREVIDAELFTIIIVYPFRRAIVHGNRDGFLADDFYIGLRITRVVVGEELTRHEVKAAMGRLSLLPSFDRYRAN